MYAPSACKSGRGRGRLYDNQNSGFGPLFDTSFTLTAQIRRGVSIAPAAYAARSLIVPA
jgi:hypothetical protein